MSHLLILCEGETEQRVLKSFLQPYWSQRFDSAEVQHYAGAGELKSKFAADAKLELSDPDSSVLCLVDLYEEPFKLYFPGKMAPEDGFKVVQMHMYSLIDRRFHHRFGAFPVVMELETWLLADLKTMQRIGANAQLEPETIEHPVGYLEKLYHDRKRNYGKIVDGITLFGFASAVRVYQDNCPHFIALVDWLTNPPPAPPNPIPAKLEEWEQERTRLHERWSALDQRLENEPNEDLLQECIQAEQALNDHLKLYGQL